MVGLKKYIQAQVDSLHISSIHVTDRLCTLHHQLHLTMLDGKACNYVTIFMKTIHLEPLKYGLSTLHMWIRIFECLLHIAYKLDIGYSRARGGTEKEKVEQRKKNIQLLFKEKIHMNVDVVQGFGTSKIQSYQRILPV